jgi:hypothetical protein
MAVGEGADEWGGKGAGEEAGGEEAGDDVRGDGVVRLVEGVQKGALAVVS